MRSMSRRIKSVLLWCYTAAAEKKEEGAKASGSGKGGTKYGQHVQDRSKVDEIYEQLLPNILQEGYGLGLIWCI